MFTLRHKCMYCIWVRSHNCGCLVTWFCYQLIAKPGNKTATVVWPDPYACPKLGQYCAADVPAYISTRPPTGTVLTTKLHCVRFWVSVALSASYHLLVIRLIKRTISLVAAAQNLQDSEDANNHHRHHTQQHHMVKPPSSPKVYMMQKE